jgi:hypothetical protein
MNEAQTEYKEARDYYLVCKPGTWPRFYHVWYNKTAWIIQTLDVFGNTLGWQRVL